MPYIYENDPTKIGTNLQTAVAYLLSLHKNEYEWNLLGIKVVGVKEALPIPDGTYDYGDAYMIGTEADDYKMWIYTRADEVHPEAYWFNIGAFPKPGPQGPKGDGLEQINKWTNGTVSNATYDTTEGAKVLQTTTVDYTDSTDGSTKQQQFETMTTLPIVPGKYVSMDATSDNKKMEVKVDDTQLALDYIKISKTLKTDSSPVIQDGITVWYPTTQYAQPQSIVWRNSYGDSSFYRINAQYLGYAPEGDSIDFYTLYSNTRGSDYTIDKTPTDTGTLTTTQINVLTAQFQAKNLRIIYDNQVYIRMDPLSYPNGTLNYIHIDSIQDNNSGYKATCKCFSVTISTRAWQVFDLDFGRSTRTTHNLTLNNGTTDTKIYFSLTNNRPETYEDAPAGLWAALENSPIACTVENAGTYSAGIITIDGDNFKIMHGNSEEALIEQMQVSITDSLV